jgi:hypothetical protein
LAIGIINLIIYFTERKDFIKKMKNLGKERALAYLEQEEAFDRTNKRGLNLLFLPGLKLARKVNKAICK